MCGLVGFLDPAGGSADAAASTVERMHAALRHRGPDDAGAWVDGAAGIALGHRRLSIVDLSAAGQQPMTSPTGRYVIAFNGEIYNHLEIREALEADGHAPAWRGHSDTETLLAAIDHRGIEATLRDSVGMFAFALWDRGDRVLTLARDRLGEKPLYYGWQNRSLLFASELKALRRHPAFDAPVDRRVLALYLKLGYIPAPHSIYSGIFKLPPGTFVQLAGGASPGAPLEPRAYWSLDEVARRGLADPFVGSDEEAVSELDARLRRSVSQQRLADVPLGAFLSGGIDSSTVVALMQDLSDRPVQTFTIGFQESAYDEAAYAAKVAAHLSTDHTELIVTPRDTIDVIPGLATMYDEPFGDSSAIPTFLVSKLARQSVTVSLSGDGGDELFCGYARYRRTADAWSRIRRIPRSLRGPISTGLGGLARHLRPAKAAWKADRLARYLAADGAASFYDVQLSQRHDERALTLGHEPAKLELDAPMPAEPVFDPMMHRDLRTYLPDDILVKVDRASMAVSLESRVPMLDHRVVELAWQLPLGLKMRDGQGKWILRQVLGRYVPLAHFERPKMGFGVPVGLWIRGPLREWAESLLSEDRLRREGFLDPALVRDQWRQHLDGGGTGGETVWQVLMFQEWLASITGSRD